MNASAVVFHYSNAATHDRSPAESVPPVQASQRESKSEWSERLVGQVPVSSPAHVVNIRGPEDTKHSLQNAREEPLALRIRSRTTRDRTAQIATLRGFITNLPLVRLVEGRISENKFFGVCAGGSTAIATGLAVGMGAPYIAFIASGMLAVTGSALFLRRHCELTDQLAEARRIHEPDVERASEWIQGLEQIQASVTARAFLERSLPTEIVDSILGAAYPALAHNAEPPRAD